MPFGNVPSYVNIKTLAAELEISETQVYALVRGGVLPKPLKLSAGCVRWSWASVEAALASLQPGGQQAGDADPDPIMQMIRDAEMQERGEGLHALTQRPQKAPRAQARWEDLARSRPTREP